MDTRNYCVECNMPRPCECDYVPLFDWGILGKYYFHPQGIKNITDTYKKNIC